MIPILYDANETAFTSKGLGALADSVSVKIARVLNGKDELTMVYPDTGIRFNDLQNDRIVYAQPEYKKTPQPYQIYKITKPLNGLVTVCARQAAMLRSSFLPVLPFSDGSLTGVFNKLPDKLLESSPITFWTNKTVTADFNLTRPASLGNVLGGMEGSILDVYGGEYEFDGYTIKLWNQRGADNHAELRYGKNITNIEQSEDFASIVTGVVPYWENMDGDTVTLPEHAVYGSMAGSYPFARTIVKDFSESFDDMPTEAQLRAKAVSYVENSQLPNVNLKVNFEHLAQYTEYEGMTLLETVNLGDTVAIYYEPLGVSASARIVSTNYDCLNEKYDSVQVGNVRSSLEQVMSGIADSAASVKDVINKTVPGAIESAVNNATAMITGVDGGYYIVNTDANGHPYEVLFMDSDDIDTAVNVLRINRNGIGFSTSGYSGPYTSAWTIDGNFVADFITTGTLTANVIKAGIIQDILAKNSWNLETGDFTLTHGTIRIVSNNANSNLIVLQYGNIALTLTPTYVVLNNTTNDTAVKVEPDAVKVYYEFVDGTAEHVGVEVTGEAVNLYSPDPNNAFGDILQGKLDLTDGLIFYNANGSTSAEFPAHYKSRASLGTVTPYSSRGTVNAGGFYRVGSQCNINFTFTSSYAGTNAPRIAGMTAHPQFTSPLQAYDLTSGEAVGCYVNTSGNIYLSTSVSGHEYAIGGTFII